MHRAAPHIRARAAAAALVASALMLDTSYRSCRERTGFYMASGEYIATDGELGRRTRLYINVEAAQRALERGELYTLVEYIELSTPDHRRKRR